MSKRSTRLIIPVGLLAVLLIGGISYLRESSPLFNLFFSPSDLYSSLDEQELNLSNEMESHSLSFEAKYPGNHAIFIDVSKVIPIGEKYGGEYLIKVEITDAKNLPLISETVSTPAYSFWRGRLPGGIALLAFDAPEDVPLKQPLVANILVLKSDSEFQERLGPLTLVVRKYSDE